MPRSYTFGRLEQLGKYDSSNFENLDAQIYGNLKKFGPDQVCRLCMLKAIYCGSCPIKKDLQGSIEIANAME